MKQLEDIIRDRRSVSPGKLNGKKIANETIQQLLQLADWAPTHGRTEPWRFVVYAGGAAQRFCNDHAELYKANTPEEKYLQATYDKFLHMGDNASHIIAVYSKRGENPNIPVLEEIAATACAVQNILLGAEEQGIAVLWSTGGMTLKPAMKQYFQLREEDTMMGLLYMGYSDNVDKTGKRAVPLEEKVQWHQ
ncbi:nitroreductase family protein [Deminuibacter soli]|uniref:Putative NAD(P)H nitroreductase n=1 Tax=Deminuibacter soli TaxID=2291815 RepID=A0A3E1NRS9_9BACT|nr:nitroreductase [Deminuibacter soli]RFM30468.1 nitroreductase [Deminuibacter soli]